MEGMQTKDPSALLLGSKKPSHPRHHLGEERQEDVSLNRENQSQQGASTRVDNIIITIKPS